MFYTRNWLPTSSSTQRTLRWTCWTNPFTCPVPLAKHPPFLPKHAFEQHPVHRSHWIVIINYQCVSPCLNTNLVALFRLDLLHRALANATELIWNEGCRIPDFRRRLWHCHSAWMQYQLLELASFYMAPNNCDYLPSNPAVRPKQSQQAWRLFPGGSSSWQWRAPFSSSEPSSLESLPMRAEAQWPHSMQRLAKSTNFNQIVPESCFINETWHMIWQILNDLISKTIQKLLVLE